VPSENLVLTGVELLRLLKILNMYVLKFKDVLLMFYGENVVMIYLTEDDSDEEEADGKANGRKKSQKAPKKKSSSATNGSRSKKDGKVKGKK
jgi:hypothetical protein